MVFDYLDAGADDEITIRRNKDAYSQLELHYRILAGLSPPLDMSTRVMGRDVKIPFFVSPTAGSKMFHADGEVGVARAASAAGAMYSLSTMGTAAPAEVAPAVPAHHPKLFQLYVWKDRSLVRDMLAQARENGFHALALTVDLTWYGNRERDHRNGFTVPPAYTAKQTWEAMRRPAWTWDFLSSPEYAYAAVAFIRDAFDPSFSWDDAEWLCQEWNEGPVALKGVVRPSDALKAVDRGFDAVWVSNHGGRQLETAPAPIDVLPSIRDAMGGIVVDGGVQRGTDVLKGLAMGADAVAIGKPYLYGLCAGGEAGVRKAFDVLTDELERAMGLLGVGTVRELRARMAAGEELVRRRHPSPRDFPDRGALDRGYGGGVF
ncbi:glycolate oxidase [Micromonas commoda]|uniref:Glycolate oxidase n=1 Tax=Micromonas commoda (strain RCC299 / NOUM17 / CCMP2709) TaxID=296587 RepID=C1EE71_MICCC|nr:glycolate oxidase [Micromonas commoda]ACO66182.1 glycolate oxidase [Micromonas commoda]|eukprot:XP_002504924.1 glycolate oxidase [Micromonas commoda]